MNQYPTSMWSYNMSEFLNWCSTMKLDIDQINSFYKDKRRYQSGTDDFNFYYFFKLPENIFHYSLPSEQGAEENYYYFPQLSAAVIYLMISTYMQGRKMGRVINKPEKETMSNTLGYIYYSFELFDKISNLAQAEAPGEHDPSITILDRLLRSHKNYEKLFQLRSECFLAMRAYLSINDIVLSDFKSDNNSVWTLDDRIYNQYDTRTVMLKQKFQKLEASTASEPDAHVERIDESFYKQFLQNICQQLEEKDKQSNQKLLEIRTMWSDMLHDIFCVSSQLPVSNPPEKSQFNSFGIEIVNEMAEVEKEVLNLLTMIGQNLKDENSPSLRDQNLKIRAFRIIAEKLSSSDDLPVRNAALRYIDDRIKSILPPCLLGAKIENGDIYTDSTIHKLRTVGEKERSFEEFIELALSDFCKEYILESPEISVENTESESHV